MSYVVNGGPRAVTEEKVQRVRAAIEELGYEPNSSAQALRTGRAPLIGLIIPDVRNQLIAELAHAVEAAAARSGFAVALANSNNDVGLEVGYSKSLSRMQPEGLIVGRLWSSHDLAPYRSAGRPVTFINEFREVKGFFSVAPDSYQGAYLATSHLIDHGRNRVAIVTGDEAMISHREDGWRAAVEERGFSADGVFRTSFTYAGGYEAGKALLRSEQRFDGVFAASDRMAIGVLHALHEAGVRVPSDIAVASFDGTAEARYAWPSLTGSRQPLESMAAAAVASVLTGEPSTGRWLAPMTLTIGQSCGCVPARTDAIFDGL